MAKFKRTGARKPLADGVLMIGRGHDAEGHVGYTLYVRDGETEILNKGRYLKLELTDKEAKRFVEFYKTNIDHLR